MAQRKIAEAKKLLQELIDTQQDVEKSVFDTLNQSDTILNLVRNALQKVSQLLTNMETTQAELEITHAEDEAFIRMCEAQEIMAVELGQIFQDLYEQAEDFNEKSHDSEELVYSQEEIISEMKDLLMDGTNS